MAVTMKEWAHTKAEDLKEHPNDAKIREIVNELVDATVDGRPITDDEVKKVVEYLNDELGNLSIIKESYDNQETLTMIQQIKAELAAKGIKA